MPRAGEAPLDVAFTDRSTGDPGGWNRDFGDGESSALQHPVHLYVDDGTYAGRATADMHLP